MLASLVGDKCPGKTCKQAKARNSNNAMAGLKILHLDLQKVCRALMVWIAAGDCGITGQHMGKGTANCYICPYSGTVFPVPSMRTCLQVKIGQLVEQNIACKPAVHMKEGHLLQPLRVCGVDHL